MSKLLINIICYYLNWIGLVNKENGSPKAVKLFINFMIWIDDVNIGHGFYYYALILSDLFNKLNGAAVIGTLFVEIFHFDKYESIPVILFFFTIYYSIFSPHNSTICYNSI